jgi:hypothetical protein
VPKQTNPKKPVPASGRKRVVNEANSAVLKFACTCSLHNQDSKILFADRNVRQGRLETPT